MKGKAGNKQVSLIVITVIIIAVIAFFSGVSLWVLRAKSQRLAHFVTTMSLLDRGNQIAKHLAEQASVSSDNGSTDWRQFSRLVNTLYTVENGLQYVSVTRSNAVVFQQQREYFDNESTYNLSLSNKVDVSLSRRVLNIGTSSVPVVVFSSCRQSDKKSRQIVEIAFRKDTVAAEEKDVLDAISVIFRISLFTVLTSFGVCMVLVVWMMRREAINEERRRDEEHLKFAGVMASGIVHDFRNPMSSLKLDVQMLNREVSKGDKMRISRVHELSERICGIIERMDKVFQEFMYIARPDSTEHDEPVNIQECLQDIVDILRPRLEAAVVTVRFDMADEPLFVDAYEASLHRAFMNVITNAVQFSKKGGEVIISVKSSGGKVIIDILDRGVGVPESERENIFEMFVSTRPGGTGLGLFLSRMAIERCKGTIAVYEREGGGSDFRIVLPQYIVRTER